MREAQLRDAKSAFSAVVEDAAAGRPTLVTRHGKPVAVVLGFAEWQRLSGAAPSFADLLLDFPGGEMPRDPSPPRDPGL
ncbi:MAG TPA: type II toxin-antitoxin system Phd/YefM family antitoxin [Crenalkalicoccus sp.]|nr:type II toxin-antitoxin system Phd/YefM family antitoxin [Crenalkalicoccus sp.]